LSPAPDPHELGFGHTSVSVVSPVTEVKVPTELPITVLGDSATQSVPSPTVKGAEDRNDTEGCKGTSGAVTHLVGLHTALG